MPTIKEIWEKKNGYTKSASELSRNLCFAGLAVVWVFRVPDGGHSAIPTFLIWCAAGFVLALGLDLAQYILGASRTKAFGDSVEDQIEEKKQAGVQINRETEQFLYPSSHRTVMDGFWAAKVIVTIATWSVLFGYVVSAAVDSMLPKIG